uniref:DUF4283 domain-containing protein n=1 Tax=Tanacetum cinerariifolium TaxID=118510 RepID=A0A6L2NIS2_TANCI|nr:hypothetical protein [Tanacetum cinerariifolium]
MDSTGAIKSVLKSTSTGGGLASKVRNIEGNLMMPIRSVMFTKPLNDKVAADNEQLKKVVKIKEMRNEFSVHGTVVTIPIETVKAVNARFVNPLYGYFIGDHLAFPLVENYVKNTWAKYGLKQIQLHEEFFLYQFDTHEGMESVLENGPWLIRRVPLIMNEWTPNTILKKDGIKHVHVWVKMHHVPIVAYSYIGLSLISTQIGKPLMLDSYTSNMCMHSWGRSMYARVLIEISADVDLMDSLVIAIPRCDKEGHTFAMIEFEYEWTPPRCASCKIFDHVSYKCPKLPKEVSNVKITDDGFTKVKKKKAKGKKNNKKQVEGVRLTKPALNLQYRRVEKGETSKQKVISKENVKSVKNGSSKPLADPTKVTTTNSFSALAKDESKTWDEDNGGLYGDGDHVVNDSDSEDVDEYITMEEGTESGTQESTNAQGASTPFEGTRIIVGWNHDDVDVSVIHQDPQVIHSRVWIKADRKEFFCSFVYALNYYIHRRPLWNGLCLHKNYINNRPWCLLGDFSASLYVDDTSIGPSSLDITMREFKECVETMEVMDVQRTGFHFTWNQKPKGKDGILCKLDRVLANLEFQDWFMGAHAMFKPYRISDHSPSVFSIPSFVTVKPKPFKFFNVAILDKKKLKGLKKPIRKMMYDNGNLHANVIRLRENLDRLQATLDNDPSKVNVREEEAAAVVAFNEAILLEEKFLKQKAKITWLHEGDANTAYFYKMVRIRVSRSRIDVVMDINGAVFQNDNVAKAFINHYEVFLGQAGATTDFDTNNLFSTRLDANEALDMVRVVSNQEVKSATFSMGNDKSPGPDGFTAAFFKDTWNIIGSDVTKAVCGVLQALCVTSSQLVTLLGLVLALHRRFVSAFMVVCGVGRMIGCDGSLDTFSVQRVWETIRPRDNEVPWYDLVWFSSCIPRHAVHMWLIIKKRLKTHDALSSWDVAAGLTVVCPLCKTQPNTHEHLFFDCRFSHQIWSRVKQNVGLSASGSSLDFIVSILMPIAKRKSFKSCIGKLTLAATAYFVWQKRNLRLFKISKRSIQEVVDCVMSSVRLKLLSCRFKKSKDAVLFSRLLGATFVYFKVTMFYCLCTIRWFFPIGVLGYVMVDRSHMACHMSRGCSSCLA